LIGSRLAARGRSSHARVECLWIVPRLAGAALAFLGLGLIKRWFWFELKTHVIVREIKRVEAQVAGLAGVIREGQSKS